MGEADGHHADSMGISGCGKERKRGGVSIRTRRQRQVGGAPAIIAVLLRAKSLEQQALAGLGRKAGGRRRNRADERSGRVVQEGRGPNAFGWLSLGGGGRMMDRVQPCRGVLRKSLGRSKMCDPCAPVAAVRGWAKARLNTTGPTDAVGVFGSGPIPSVPVASVVSKSGRRARPALHRCSTGLRRCSVMAAHVTLGSRQRVGSSHQGDVLATGPCLQSVGAPNHPRAPPPPGSGRR